MKMVLGDDEWNTSTCQLPFIQCRSVSLLAIKMCDAENSTLLSQQECRSRSILNLMLLLIGPCA